MGLRTANLRDRFVFLLARPIRWDTDMAQRDKKKIAGQERAIREHQAKKAAYPSAQDKAFAQKTIDNAKRHLDKLKGR